jgi:hypothetical protein
MWLLQKSILASYRLYERYFLAVTGQKLIDKISMINSHQTFATATNLMFFDER